MNKNISEEVKKITVDIENKLKEYIDSDEYMEILKIASKFHQYSLNNRMLIYMQKPTATYVKSFKSWNTDFKRHVKKGEKGIKIFVPMVHYVTEQITNDDGEEETKQQVSYVNFKLGTVFDIQQTEGPEIEGLNHDLKGEIKDFDQYLTKIKNATNDFVIDIKENTDDQLCKGYCDFANKLIVVYKNSTLQMFKTLIHEKAHSMLHGKDSKLSRNEKECQAESIAYVVCSYLGLDVSSYSNAYLSGWTTNKEFTEIKSGLDLITKTSQEILNILLAG